MQGTFVSGNVLTAGSSHWDRASGGGWVVVEDDTIERSFGLTFFAVIVVS